MKQLNKQLEQLQQTVIGGHEKSKLIYNCKVGPDCQGNSCPRLPACNLGAEGECIRFHLLLGKDVQTSIQQGSTDWRNMRYAKHMSSHRSE